MTSAIGLHIFFHKHPVLGLILELLSGLPKIRLEVAMMLLTFFFDDFRLKRTKFGKIEESYQEFI